MPLPCSTIHSVRKFSSLHLLQSISRIQPRLIISTVTTLVQPPAPVASLTAAVNYLALFHPSPPYCPISIQQPESFSNESEIMFTPLFEVLQHGSHVPWRKDQRLYKGLRPLLTFLSPPYAPWTTDLTLLYHPPWSLSFTHLISCFSLDTPDVFLLKTVYSVWNALCPKAYLANSITFVNL